MAVENSFTTMKLEKQAFQLRKSRRDGLMLQVYHSIPGKDGEIQRVRFTSMVFDEKYERLAAVDHRGNVFVIDLLTCKVWSLPSLGICTVVAYASQSKNTLVVGTTDCCLNFMNTETGSVTQSLKGHTLPVKQVSFSCNGHFCLSVSYEEAIIWNLASGCVAHRLAMHTDVSIKQVMFMPGSNCVLVCFQDDSMNVWNVETLECVKRIVPDMWKSSNLKTITFTRNGRAMVVGGRSSQLVVFSLDTWSLRNCVKLPVHVGGVKLIEFLPQEFDSGANKILVMLSTNCSLYFLDMETECILKTNMYRDSIVRKFACSPTGKYIATLLHSGEVNIYQSSLLLGSSSGPKNVVQGKKSVEKQSPRRRSLGKQKRIVEEQMKKELQLQRLQPILKQFGEYPEAYRGLIWRTVLQLPKNQAAFVSLVNRDCHSAYRDVGKIFPQETRTVVKNLRRVLSCLAYWCPLFAEVKYLPVFTLPFVILLQNNPLDCFELLVTLIVNWCQHWFEYFPYVPTNILSMAENVLQEHDPQLLQFLCERGVTAELYAWEILQAGFSQVLTVREWYVLWDHVLSNEPSFLLMAVVAYNIVCRAAIKSCKTAEDFQVFYHSRNAIDMKRFLSKCYQLLNVTSEDAHPRQYLQKFQPLESGVYPVFTGYSKSIVDHQVQLLENIRAENERLANEYRAAMEREAEKEYKRNRQALHEQHEDRLRCAEDAFQAEILKEEFRVAEQRRKVMELHKEMRARELEAVEEITDNVTCHDIRKRQASLNRALGLMKLKSCREVAVVSALEDEVSGYLHQFKIKKLQKDLAAEDNSSQSTVVQKLRKVRQDTDITSSIAVVEQLMDQINQELAKEMASSQHNEKMSHTAHKVRELENQTRQLEAEVKCLLEKLAERRQQDTSSEKEDEQRHETHQRDVSHTDDFCIATKEKDNGESSLTSKYSVQSVRGWDVYQREKQAIKNAMKSREKFLSVSSTARRHLGSLNTR